MHEVLPPIAPRQLGEMVAGELLRKCWLAGEAGVDLDVATMGTVELLPSTPPLPWLHTARWPSPAERSDHAWRRDYYLGVVTVLAPAQGWCRRSAAVRTALRQSSECLASATA
jgi:hypothetical protein